MTPQSAHRDVALWRYESPSRGYAGFHLRARNRAARSALRDRMATIAEGESHLLKLARDLSDWPRDGHWPVVGFEDMLLSVGRTAAPPPEASCAIALTPETLSDLTESLHRIAPQEERAFAVETSEGPDSLWLWWDVDP